MPTRETEGSMEGSSESECPSSTSEAGELEPKRTLRREGGHQIHGAVGAKDGRDTET